MSTCTIHTWRAASLWRSAGIALLAAASGCQTYTPQPLNLSAHREAFIARTPESPEVREFAQTLSDSEGLAPDTFDPSDGITLVEAEAIALVLNAELRIARLRAGVTQAGAANAGLWEDPTIGVDITRILESTAHPWKVFSAVGFTLPISGRLEIEKALAGIEHAADLARVAEREWQVRMELRRAWADWSSLAAQLKTTREFLERVDQILVIVDLMERAGELARTEARLFRVEHATKALELATLEAQNAEWGLRIRQLMGLAPEADIRMIAGGGVGRQETDVAGDSREPLHDRLMRASPLLLVEATEYQVAERALELEVRKQYPDLQIGPGYGNEDGQNQFLLGLSLPLPVLNGNRRAIAEAAANRDLARASAESTLERLITDLAAAEVQVRVAELRRRTLEEAIVPMVDAQYADAREVARLGEVNTLVLLESLKRQQEAKIALIQARRDQILAAIRVEEILGPVKRAEMNPEPSDAVGATP